MDKEMHFCQSCGMPLTDEILGTNADGSKNEEYCIYCFKDGAFTGDFTMEEMIEFCSQFVEQYNKDSGQNLTQEEYNKLKNLPLGLNFVVLDSEKTGIAPYFRGAIAKYVKSLSEEID